ncbi:hypothetical protein PWG15_22205 (plasmid) [Ensifer adhaerens]|uniref:hypothetical protein n=1 Tax=Ensifer adhaerens TaxID=106592 RepID=UPI0023A9E012|nr:hypothetical protein [Ensifer adhaerens]WDZ80499.1 hypothetical protein PWG15_22205 [Ensifer adhaerens]
MLIAELSALERSRLVEIVEAAKAADWERFASLTARPFASAEAMQEQFWDASRILRVVRDEPTVEVVLKHHEDGSRLIFAKVVFQRSGGTADRSDASQHLGRTGQRHQHLDILPGRGLRLGADPPGKEPDAYAPSLSRSASRQARGVMPVWRRKKREK